MRVDFQAFSNSWKAVKVMRTPKPKFYRQTSLFEYFSSVEPLEEPSEEDDSFIVPDELPVIDEEESLDLGPNLFEEQDSDKDDDEKDSFYQTFKELEMNELIFTKEDGSFDLEKYNQWIGCPVCDDCSFKDLDKTEV